MHSMYLMSHTITLYETTNQDITRICIVLSKQVRKQAVLWRHNFKLYSFELVKVYS